jgi:transposase-like protein
MSTSNTQEETALVEELTGKKRPGRKSKYREEFAEQAYILCKEYGFTYRKLAEFFKVDPASLKRWEREHEEFHAAVRGGRDEFDSEKVEKSLSKRAQGYRYREVTKEACVVRRKGEDPELYDKELVVTKVVTKEVPPDTTAAAIWLNNRRRDRWKRQYEEGAEGRGQINIIVNVPEPKPLPPEFQQPAIDVKEPKQLEGSQK